MLKFNVKAKGLWSVRQRELAREAAQFAMNFYGITAMTIKLTNLEGYLGTSGVINGRNLIAVSPGTDEMVLRTIFHEMTHTFQYMHQGLTLWDTETKTIGWKGETLSFDMDNQEEYDNAEWEKEANSAENVLLAMFTLSRK